MSPPQVITEAGASTLEVEEPDVIVYRMRGRVDGQQLRSLRAAERRWNVDKPYLLVLIDISGQEHSTMDARKAAVEPMGGTAHRALAISGGSRYTRVLVELVMRALRLLSSSKAQVRFFDDEASARVWLDEQRSDLAAASAAR